MAGTGTAVEMMNKSEDFEQQIHIPVCSANATSLGDHSILQQDNSLHGPVAEASREI